MKKQEKNIKGYRISGDRPPVITQIAYQKKDKLRASVFIAGEFAFGINVATIERFRLRKGDELTEQLLEDLRGVDYRISAKRVGSKFLNARRRTEKEVREKLLKSEFDDTITQETIEDLVDAKLIDDEAYTQAFIHDKRIAKPISSRQLANELRRKGVRKEIIVTALATSDESETEEDRATLAAKKKWELLLRREPDERKRTQKLIAFLGSRGFPFDVIKRIARNISTKIEAEEFE
ncbi:MAG: RecX family transcriptional regulator [bacterium]